MLNMCNNPYHVEKSDRLLIKWVSHTYLFNTSFSNCYAAKIAFKVVNVTFAKIFLWLQYYR
jgi:hypothetical protein